MTVLKTNPAAGQIQPPLRRYEVMGMQVEQDSEFAEKLEGDMSDAENPQDLFRIAAIGLFTIFLLLDQRAGRQATLGFLNEAVTSLGNDNAFYDA